MTMERRRMKLSGRVQGVGFRMFTRMTAQRIGLTGWVRNCADGGVELEAQGNPDDLDAFENALYTGPPLGRVNKLNARQTSPVEGEQAFEIRH